MSRSNTSPIWTFFDVIDKENAKCKKCSKNVKRAGGTTNLRNHLKNNHFNAFYEMQNKRSSEGTPIDDEHVYAPDTDNEGACAESSNAGHCPVASNTPRSPLASSSSHSNTSTPCSTTLPSSSASASEVSCGRELG